ncbi:MAG: cyclic nucleotide-binding domain-containing protein [Methyloprofundus sp.]|nr:cyclic nucleotide-binding domain-containing protein [Methyloprofundus sp.]
MKTTLINQAWNGTEKCEQCPIRHLVLFADLQHEDFNQIHVPINDLEIDTGNTLYKEKEDAQFVYTIRSGMVKLVRYLPNGSYRIVRLLHQGDLAGIEALSSSPYLHHAVTLQNTSVCRIPIENIEQLNLNSPHLYKQLTARWQKVQNDADIWLAELTVGNSKKRVANLLLYLSHYSTDDYFYLPSREDIGAILAITTETASRIIAEFKRLGYLRTEHQSAIINITKLKQIG